MEERAAYVTDAPPIPADLLAWWRRVTALERGMVYSITLIVPPQKDKEAQWVVTPLGKVENRK